ncbi:hypothetical protein E2C01_040557 [Portunus trituberculatus]|uniref:Uncharacterized protein n=1 Tax=Portunus trituberculatus TaxID=210409 RepID=A0A5B7FNB5_PORTR|nr:hypothetical protein [Portunus trituberculatus]
MNTHYEVQTIRRQHSAVITHVKLQEDEVLGVRHLVGLPSDLFPFSAQRDSHLCSFEQLSLGLPVSPDTGTLLLQKEFKQSTFAVCQLCQWVRF